MPEADKYTYFLIDLVGKSTDLTRDKHFFIGRAPGNNIVVNDTKISRRHVEIWWDGSSFILQDLNSSNGSKVNDKTITTVTLENGDNIAIGSQLFVYRKVSKEESVTEVKKQVMADHRGCSTQIMEIPAGLFPPDADFSGTLTTISSSDLCQMLNVSRRSGLLLIKTELSKALIYFADGDPVQAEYQQFLGDEAVLAILKQKTGYFSFRKNQKPIEKNVNSKFAHLLLEAARQHDESGLS